MSNPNSSHDASAPLSPGIDPRACIDPSAVIGQDVQIGPWTYIGPNVTIGDKTVIRSHVVIERDTHIGCRNMISSYAAIGGDPQDASYAGQKTELVIGDDNVFREFVTVNRGSQTDGAKTVIGNRCFLLAYSHVAHDCQLGNDILMVNNATIAGHVVIDDYVILGAFTAVHQFCHVGAYSFLARATEISKDIPPYMLVKGLPGYPCGLNLVGLKRRGFSDEAIRSLKQAYKLMYRQGLAFEEIIQKLTVLSEKCSEVGLILEFIQSSQRGIARRAYEDDALAD
jgi:UDP-N-acetylglucosamine acyltransferase